MPDRDPNYRDASVYEYGQFREITLRVTTRTEILWTYIYTDQDGVRQHVGGFPGPFEALAHGLQTFREQAQQQERQNNV